MVPTYVRPPVQIPLAVLAYSPRRRPLKWVVDWVKRSSKRMTNIIQNNWENHDRVACVDVVAAAEGWAMLNVGAPLHHVLGAAFALPAYLYKYVIYGVYIHS